MSEQPWGVDAGDPLDEGSEPTAEGTADLGERRAGADPTAWDASRAQGKEELAYDPEAEHAPRAGEQGGQPNLSPDPAVAGRRSNLGQGSTDDSPGTPSGI
ncbi:hypothetical protein [Actinoplanes teichomyceticus]|uniref:Uncharacterized protein n=1 Tax=Actinoplanes teichomyceticus TaxID=1867 RepID=A0A561WBA3_ACTTI|nr:hypothetical protein [Actinoplanes teichomyceticus]TWG21146.1 hypothetical protein FHX34_103676 [Actinoplanes teichomyceticus]GIF14967.1 hypothetical protein Ate01nite_49990 [Actinoplanes teichomyceticus]